jgi:hypothetical protein
MSTMVHPMDKHELTGRFVVIHPLDDLPEEKVDTGSLGPMPMTTVVRISLLSLRGYLLLMMLLVLYHVMDLAGVFGRHA